MLLYNKRIYDDSVLRLYKAVWVKTTRRYSNAISMLKFDCEYCMLSSG
jgi:hypothetical protein